jgi:outer membrane protein TolC
MRLSKTFGIFAALVAASIASSARAQGPLTLEQAVQLALTRNERAKIADLNVDAAKAAVEKARAGFLPTVVYTASATQRPYEIANKGVVSTPYNSATNSLTITQPLLSLPAWPLYRQSERLYDAQRAQTVDDKRVLAFDAARAFFQALNTQEVLRAAQRRVEYSQSALSDSAARVAAQLNSSNDVTRNELEVATAQREVANDEGGVERAFLNLAFVLNAQVTGAQLAAPDAMIHAAEVPAQNLDRLIAVAFQRRMDLVATQHRAVAAHLFADEPMLRLVPTIALVGQIRGNTVPEGSTARWDDETIGLNLTWTIYDASVRYADKRQREALAEISELDTQILKRQIDLQVRTAASSLASAQAAYRVSQRAVESARKSAEETAVLYRQGLARAIELTDASTNRFVAEVSLAEAELAMTQAFLDVRQAMGLDPIGTELR